MSLAIPLSNRGADYIHAAYGGDRFKQNQYSMHAGNDAARVIVNPIYKGMGYPAAGINTTSFSGPTRLASSTAPTPYDIKKIKRRGKKATIKQGAKKPAYNAGVEYAADQPSTHAQVLALNARNEAAKKSFDTMQQRATERRASDTSTQQSSIPSVIRNLNESPRMITDPVRPEIVSGFERLLTSPTFRGFAEPTSRMALTPTQQQAPMLTSSLAPQQPTASEGVERPTVVDAQQDVVDKTMEAQPKAFVSELPFAPPPPPPPPGSGPPPPPPGAARIPKKRSSTEMNDEVSPQMIQARMAKLNESTTRKKKPDVPVSPELLKEALEGLKKSTPINKAPPIEPTNSRFGTAAQFEAQSRNLRPVQPASSKPASKDNPLVAHLKKSVAKIRQSNNDDNDDMDESWN